jgi:RNA polymerase sigma-70 factor (ECF subfamily)
LDAILYTLETAYILDRKPAPVTGGDEAALLRSLREGNREAAEALVEGSLGKVYGLLHHLCAGDADLAADLAQETYRKAWEALSGFDGRSAFSTWVFRIAYNTYLNHLRAPLRLVPLEEGHASFVQDPAPGPEHAARAEDLQLNLIRAVMGLPEDLRLAVMAHYWGELSVAEIARMEGITGMAVRKRLKKAFALLSSALEEAGS